MTWFSQFLARTGPSLAGLFVFALFMALWLGGYYRLYDALLLFWGMHPFRFPFLDLYGSLAAWDCARQGVDVILADPCDIMHRGYNYSPLWMNLTWIPLTRGDLNLVGIILSGAFLISLSALPVAQSRDETALRIAAVLSTMIVLAVERANPDIMIFILVAIMLVLLRCSVVARTMGYAIAFLAGAIKYYPFILLGLAVRERVRLLVLVTLVSILAFAAFVAIYFEPIREGFPHITSGGPFGDMTGAKNLPFGVFLIIRDNLFVLAGGMIEAINICTYVAMAVATLATLLVFARVARAMIRLWRATDVPATLRRMDEARRISLFAGALLLSGCFVTGQSYGYRGVFIFLILPGLSAIARETAAGPIATASRNAAIYIVVLMWAEALRGFVHSAVIGLLPLRGLWAIPGQVVEVLAWSAREFAWWFVIAFLFMLLFGFFVDSPLFRSWRGRVATAPTA